MTTQTITNSTTRFSRCHYLFLAASAAFTTSSLGVGLLRAQEQLTERTCEDHDHGSDAEVARDLGMTVQELITHDELARRVLAECRPLSDDDPCGPLSLEMLEEFSQLGDREIEAILRLPRIEAVHLVGSRCTDLSLRTLSKAKWLRSVSLKGCAMSDAAIRDLIVCLPNLEALFIQPWGVAPMMPSSSTMKAIGGAPHLERLMVRNIKAPHAGCGHLVALRHLRELDLQSGRLNGQALAYLAKVPRLERLTISGGPELTDEAIAELTSATRLEALTIESAEALTSRGYRTFHLFERLKHLSPHLGTDDEALRYISQIDSLESLDLRGRTEVTDEGVLELMNMPRLSDLYVTGTSITVVSFETFGRMPRLVYLQAGEFPTALQSWYENRASLRSEQRN